MALCDQTEQALDRNINLSPFVAENGGAMAPGAKTYLEKRKIEEQIAYDEAMKRKHAAIVESKRCKVDCKPRPIQDCLKPDYTIDDDVIGCSKGEATKSW